MKKSEKQTDTSPNMISKTQQNNPDSVELEDKVELQRREAYVDTQNRDILRFLLQSGDKSEIVPIYSCSAGYSYELPDPENKKFNSTISTERLLDLAKLDIITKEFYEKASSCPNCTSIRLTMHNTCPKCKSHNIQKTGLIEHIPCGHIDQEDKYLNDRCPKCGQLLIEGQYRNMGRWYICQACGDRFESPEFELICHSCDKHFSIKEANIRDFPKFKLNANRLKEIRQNVASLEDVRKLLTDLGFQIEMPGLLVGEKSGMQHHFSIVGHRRINEREIVMALDHAVSDLEVATSPLILYIYKTSEVKVDIPIFVAMPKLNDTAKKIALGHQFLLVEGSTNNTEAIKEIKPAIESRIQQLTTTSQPESEPQKPVKEKKSLFSKLSGK